MIINWTLTEDVLAEFEIIKNRLIWVMNKQYFQFLRVFLFKRYKVITGITLILSILSAVFSGIGLGLYIPVISSFLESGETQNIFVSLSNSVISMIGLQPSLFVLIVTATMVIIVGNLTDPTPKNWSTLKISIVIKHS